jgi:hypothetical protein
MKGRGRGQRREELQEEERRGCAGTVVVPLREVEQQLAVYNWRARTNQPLLAAVCTHLQLRRGQPFLDPAALHAQIARSSYSPEDSVALRVQI